MNVLDEIKRLRKERSWSEYRLAKEAGIPQSTINSMYRKNNCPTVTTLESICDAFGITLAEFFAEDGESFQPTIEQKKLLSKWSILNSAQKESILKLMDCM